MDYFLQNFLQQLVNGLEQGSLYSLVALGLSLVYGILEMLNFAHGEVYMVGGFLGVGVATVFVHHEVAAIPSILVVLLMLAIAMPGAGILGVLIERVVYRPLRDASRLGPLIAGIGVSLLLRSLVQVQISPGPILVPTDALVSQVVFHLGNTTTPFMSAMLFLVSVIMMIGLDVFIYRTNFGAAIRATAQDREAAAFMGINIDRVIAMTFLLGSSLAGAAGVLYSLRFAQVNFLMGFDIGIKAFAAAVIGGIGNMRGAMLGGLVLGVLESLAGGFINTAFEDTFAFLILIIVLIIRPWGILGERPLERA